VQRLLKLIRADSVAMLGGFRRSLTTKESRSGASEWTELDFAEVKRYLSLVSACTTGGLGLTAEFSLVEGAVSAVTGDGDTALFPLMGDRPHPELAVASSACWRCRTGCLICNG